VAALFHIAQQLDLVPLLDSILPPKRQQGLSCGQYLLLAAINRAVCPTSKLQFADWYRQTTLTRLLPADPACLSSQHFWNHMHGVTSLLQRELASRQEELSINRILEELAGIRETLIVYPRRQGQRRFPPCSRQLTQQQTLARVYADILSTPASSAPLR
jgi:hypothetical protein